MNIAVSYISDAQWPSHHSRQATVSSLTPCAPRRRREVFQAFSMLTHSLAAADSNSIPWKSSSMSTSGIESLPLPRKTQLGAALLR